MKKCLSFLLAILMLSSVILFSVSAESAQTVLLSDSVSSVIVLPTNYKTTERYAAGKLQEYLQAITGIKVPIRTTKGVSDTAIVLSQKDGKAGDYTLKMEGKTLTITGYGTRGCIYGVYGLLQNYLDCRFYTSTVKVIPKKTSVVLPSDLDYRYEVYFESTETDWLSPHDAEYSLANGLSGGSYRNLTAEQGGMVRYLSMEGRMAHTLSTEFCAERKYFETHPEYFALRDGKRQPTQLCLTNPDVVKIVTEEVLNVLKNKHDPNEALQIISLTQDDNRQYCTCSNCRKVDELNGSQSGTMIHFVNQVARAVKAAGYDNVAIDTFAYQYTRKAPTNVVPDDNVIVRLCTIECCFGHTLDDPECSENVNLMSDLENWGKICNRIYIWDYTTNYGYTVNLFPDFGVLQRNIQIFHENNVKGIYEEGNYYMNECDAEFGELRSYLLSKLMQNPYLDYEKEMNGFLEAFYGNGWKNVRAFLDIATKHAVTKRNHMGIGQALEKTLLGITAKEVAECDALWQKAKDMAQDEVTLARVERSELCWRIWKCHNHKREFSRLRMPHKWMTAQKELYEDLIRFDVKRLGENSTRPLTDCMTLVLLRRPITWCLRYEEVYWDAIEPYVVALYELACKIFG